MTPNQPDMLILRYLDHTASPDEVAELGDLLRSDEQLRLSMREMAMQAVAMADFARERTIALPHRDQDRPANLHQRRFAWLLLAAACAALLIGGVGRLLLRHSRETATIGQTPAPIKTPDTASHPLPENVTIGHLSGAVSFTPDGGESRSGLESGARISAGTVTVEGAASSVQLSFDDGTSVTLVGDADLTLSAGAQKRLTLHRGSLAADVRPQAADQPMVIRTPTADVQVVGTRFLVAVQSDRTTLSVESGSVKMQRLADGDTIHVSHGEVAVASLDADVRMESVKPSAAPSTLHQTFDVPPASNSWRGEWQPPDAKNPGRIRCIPDFSYRDAHGKPVAAYTVALHDSSGSIASVSPQSVLRLRMRTSGRQFVLALIGLQHPTGGFAGNFLTTIKASDGTRNSNGWQTIEMPLSSLGGKFPKTASVPLGGRVFLIYLSVYSPKANLEVAEVSITPPEVTQPGPATK